MAEIRRVTYEELPCCAQVIRNSFQTVAEEFGLTRENCPKHTSFIEAERLLEEYRRGALMFGAYEGDALVGYVSLKEIGDGAWELDHLAVLPAFRHKGIGRSLLDTCVLEAKQHDITVIKIGMIEESTRLKNWYAAYGFRHTGIVRFPHLPFMVGFMELDVR